MQQTRLTVLTLGALGVVYGDIGTSPLYAFQACFAGDKPLPISQHNVFGILSLIFWSLTLIVSFKYISVIMRAGNNGEGGILSLLALAFPTGSTKTKSSVFLIALGIFGAALLYGDGIITPAISVLSALEGVNVATPALQKFVIPLTVVTLIILFLIQRKGTGKVGSIFGPVMVVWFLTLAILGVVGIAKTPEILKSLSPHYAFEFLVTSGWTGFIVLGAVFLAVTGAEALYADMGHFGIKPIRLAWFGLVMPSLFLNYLGQGALVLHDPSAIDNPFYKLAPHYLIYPLVALSTMATVIASQALISGAFSITVQAVQLDYLPRILVKHTSKLERGQIYMPHVNWFLLIACVGLVLGFKSSANLAAAYGIAVTLTMITTTLLFYVVATQLWKWSRRKTLLVAGSFLAVECVFLAANLSKVFNGGWFPLVVGACIFTIMTTWKKGRQLIYRKLKPSAIEDILSDPAVQALPRVKGTALFMSTNPKGAPIALLHNLKHNKVLHQHNILLTIFTDDVPQVEENKRFTREELPLGFERIVAHYGFMEQPDVPQLMILIEGNRFNIQDTTFFLSRQVISPHYSKAMMKWRQWLYAALARNAQAAGIFYKIPVNRIVEMGMQIEI